MFCISDKITVKILNILIIKYIPIDTYIIIYCYAYTCVCLYFVLFITSLYYLFYLK